MVAYTALYGAGFIPRLLPYAAVAIGLVAGASWVLVLRRSGFPRDFLALIATMGLVAPLGQLTSLAEVRLLVFPLMVTVGALSPRTTLLLIAPYAMGPVVVGSGSLQAATAGGSAVILSCLLPALFIGREKRRRRTLQQDLHSLTAEARRLDEAGLADTDSFLREDTFRDLVGSVIELRENLDHVVYLVKNVIPCNTAAYFSLEDDGSLILRSSITDSPPWSTARSIRAGAT